MQGHRRLHLQDSREKLPEPARSLLDGLSVTKRVSNLGEDSFNDRKHIISGLQFFKNDLNLLKIDSNLIQIVSLAASAYKRKLEEERKLGSESAKRQKPDDEFAAQLELITAIEEEKQLARSIEMQMNSVREKLDSEKAKAKKILSALSDKAADQSDPSEKINVIQELS